jgi:OOP family OmpA-OmpF porin
MQDKFLYGGRLGLGFGKRIGIEGSYGTSSTKSQEGNGYAPYVQDVASSPLDATFTHMAADLVLNLSPNSAIDPYLLGGWSQSKIKNTVDAAGTETEETYDGYNFGGGLKLHFSPRVALRLEARDVVFSFKDEETALGADDGSQNNMLYTGGLQFSLGGTSEKKDADGDGVEDKKDACPNTPANCVVDAKGCETDADGDGVCDGRDQCANTPKGARVDANGCPMDSDGDGVYDGLDQCEGTPKGCQVDANGCPMDSDRDGVCDGLDQCANTPTGATVDANGCPMDSDGDSVYDGLDKCPNTPAGVKVDVDGCPIEYKEMLETGVFRTTEILFDTGKSVVRPESEAKLREICSVISKWPTLQIEIGGHTDSQGSNAANQKLSEARANSILEWFKANCTGANIAGMTAKGYGETKPIASNKSSTGRAQNRRVEFKILNTEELQKIRQMSK